MSWKGERGLGWPAEGVGGYYELERGEGSRVGCWRGVGGHCELGKGEGAGVAC